MQYLYEEDKKSAFERLGRQATFKFRVLWSVRDGKGLIGSLDFKNCHYVLPADGTYVPKYVIEADVMFVLIRMCIYFVNKWCMLV
jgi:hypothetical protein